MISLTVRSGTIVIVMAVAAATLALAGAQRQPGAPAATPSSFTVVEASISELRAAMEDGRTTSRTITAQYLARLERYNPSLHAAISINPDALKDADARDAERRQRRRRGPLHGIPVAVKDNIQAVGMPTTGGALAFRHWHPPYDATLVRRLREAGAVIIAKTTLTELANWVAFGMPAGYNAVLGYSTNPYDLRRVLRNGVEVPRHLPGGSSSGIGTAASLWAGNVGTETAGSILSPASETMLVGVKPTVGRISRHGVIPISADLDTPGPMTRTVRDAAIMLGVLEGGAPDPQDPATRACTAPRNADYTPFLQRDALRGARIGIPRAGFVSPVTLRATSVPAAVPAPALILEEAIRVLRTAGAVLVDPADLPSASARDESAALAAWPMCTRPDQSRETEDCSIVLRYGMKRDFNAWLRTLGRAAPVPSLSALRHWNNEQAPQGAIAFGQGQLDASDAIDLDRDRARYLRDLAKDRRLTRAQGLDVVLKAQRLDALLFPVYSGFAVAARAGYPSVRVPFVPDQGRSEVPVPSGVTFTGAACSEPRLLALAYAFEQVTKRRVPPQLR